MIDFHFEYDFDFQDAELHSEWIINTIKTESFEIGEISYVFCDDSFLLKLNQEYLEHDTFTDILTFDYNLGKQMNGEIYISIDRVKENSQDFGTKFEDELRRVMIHGILHLCGYADERPEQAKEMRNKENFALGIYEALASK